jgi:hypothetical protein
VFGSFDPFGAPFRDSIARRAILWPVSYFLSDDEFEALSFAANAVGDEGFYEFMSENPPHLCALDGTDVHAGSGAFDDPPPHYYACGDLAGYDRHQNTYLETVLLSATARWGMIISHEDHAVVGGASEFVEEVLNRFPATSGFRSLQPDGTWSEAPLIPAREQAHAFFSEVHGDWPEPEKWVKRHAAHVLGEQEAKRLLGEIGFGQL